MTSVKFTALQGDLFRAVVNLESDDREELVAQLIGAGLGLRAMSEDQSGELEDVFLGLTNAPDGTAGRLEAKPAEEPEAVEDEASEPTDDAENAESDEEDES